jgi:hypothetical protein
MFARPRATFMLLQNRRAAHPTLTIPAISRLPLIDLSRKSPLTFR